MSGNVKCPVHGEHGNLSNGKCWYCVQAGITAPEQKPSLSTKKVIVWTKRKIA